MEQSVSQNCALLSRKVCCPFVEMKAYMLMCEVFDFPGTGWVADFGEVNSKAPAAGAAFSAWDIPDTQPSTTEAGEKGWAKFTDFQPFCW